MIKLIIALLFFNNSEKPLQQQMVNSITEFYSCKVYILPSQPLPATAYYVARNRYRAERLLGSLQLVKPSNANILGFTDKDISTTKGSVYDYGIMGLGSLNSGVSVMSTYRLKTGTKQEQYNKILNTVLHEIGHTFGLPHCINPKCLMRDAEGHLSPEDSMTPYMCNVCRKKVIAYNKQIR